MDSSPRSSSVKVTYLDRDKSKKSNQGQNTEIESDSSPSEEKAVSKSPPKSTEKRKRLSEMRPPDSFGSKLDFKRPETPSRKREDVSETGSKRASHVRSSSSIASLNQLARQQPSSPSSSKKPASRRGTMDAPPSPSRHGASDSEMDDATSVAESFMSSNRVRRTEAERIEYFKNQPECDLEEIEPHRVKCLRCRQYVNLGRKQTYAVRPWETHRAKCDLKVARSVLTNDSVSIRDDDNVSLAGSVTPMAQARRPRTTEAERQQMLEGDPQVAVVKPDEVLCRRCQKWIRLSNRTMYHLPNWRAHRKICFDQQPSAFVVSAESKVRIVNDPLVKSYGPHHVICALCDANVTLDGEGEYNLENWELHKDNCPSRKPMQMGTSLEAPASSVTSSGATEITLVNDVSLSSSPGRKLSGLKRPREEDEFPPLDDPDVRPPTRARTEKYVPPDKDAPGGLGWFLMPVKAFIRGFRESISAPTHP